MSFESKHNNWAHPTRNRWDFWAICGIIEWFRPGGPKRYAAHSMDNSEKQLSIIKDLQNTIQIASQNFDIWWSFKVDTNRKEFVDVMNSYLGYFNIAIHAHFVAVVIPLYRLFETRQDTHNFYELIRSTGESTNLPGEFSAEVKHRMEEMKPTWKKICILRNNVFGHSSQNLWDQDAFKRAAITSNEIKDFIEKAKQLINYISHQLFRSSHAFNLSSEDVAIELLTDLKKIYDGA